MRLNKNSFTSPVKDISLLCKLPIFFGSEALNPVLFVSPLSGGELPDAKYLISDIDSHLREMSIDQDDDHEQK
jgi:hypothetical protein